MRYRGRLNGLRSCYGGIAALAMGSMPSSAGFFVVYEVVKEKLKHSSGLSQRRDLSENQFRSIRPWVDADAAAAAAGSAGTAVKPVYLLPLKFEIALICCCLRLLMRSCSYFQTPTCRWHQHT